LAEGGKRQLPKARPERRKAEIVLFEGKKKKGSTAGKMNAYLEHGRGTPSGSH